MSDTESALFLSLSPTHSLSLSPSLPPFPPPSVFLCSPSAPSSLYLSPPLFRPLSFSPSLLLTHSLSHSLSFSLTLFLTHSLSLLSLLLTPLLPPPWPSLYHPLARFPSHALIEGKNLGWPSLLNARPFE